MTGLAGVGLLTSELIIVVAASLLIILDLAVGRKEIVAGAGVVGCAAALGWTIAVLGSATPAAGLSGMFALDGYAAFFKLIFLGNCILTILMSVRCPGLEGTRLGEYYALLLLATAGMMMMASANDLILLYLALELMTVSSYVLIGSERGSRRSNEAAIKYFLLGGFSTGFLLYGVALVYSITGTTRLDEVAMLLAGGQGGAGVPVILPVALLVVGFGFKIAAAPLHMWAPDVYEGAPTPITAFLSTGPKAAGFAAAGRVLLVGFAAEYGPWSAMLMVLAVLSMAVGSMFALAQTNIKRMLAYSSIAHVGFALLGLIAGGNDGVTGMMVYLFIYGAMNLGAFAVVVAVRSAGVEGEDLDDYAGLGRSHPLVSLLMLIFMFSLVGVPPTAGFVAKFAVFMAVIRADLAPLAVIGVVFSVVSAFFYLRVVVLMYMKEPATEAPVSVPLPLSMALAVAVLIVIGLGFYPAPILDLAEPAMLGWSPTAMLPIGGPP